eukprot:8128661-Alexandrium_andersonii.AAC.1
MEGPAASAQSPVLRNAHPICPETAEEKRDRPSRPSRALGFFVAGHPNHRRMASLPIERDQVVGDLLLVLAPRQEGPEGGHAPEENLDSRVSAGISGPGGKGRRAGLPFAG